MIKDRYMETLCFDALVDFAPPSKITVFPVLLVIKGSRIPASIDYYEETGAGMEDDYYVQFIPQCSLSLKWRDTFEVKESKGKTHFGSGIILNPYSTKTRGKKVKKRMEFLSRLKGDRKEMLSALVQEKGVKGLSEKEIHGFTRISKASLHRLSQELEGEDRVRILSFSPLLLIWQQAIDFLQGKILRYLEQFHTKHPRLKGVSTGKLKKRFGIHQKTLSLVLEHLRREGKILSYADVVALSAFTVTPSPEEERILQQLEDMCFKGEFRSVSREDLCRTFHLSQEKLNELLSLLVERNKVVLGKEGFLIHSRWLDEVISQVRGSGKKELTVADFKELTGLTRKYAIPLLELLDQMGVTRRISPTHRVIL